MFDKKELNIEEIKSLIPHRYPFLLIDRLIEIKPFESATGIFIVAVIPGITLESVFCSFILVEKPLMPLFIVAWGAILSTTPSTIKSATASISMLTFWFFFILETSAWFTWERI